MKYLQRRGDLTTDILFVNHFGEHMGKFCLILMFQRRSKKAGVTGVRCSPHTCRHTFAKNWLLNGGDVFSLQKILGHSTMDMDRTYVNLAEGDVTIQHRRYSPIDRMEIVGSRKKIK